MSKQSSARLPHSISHAPARLGLAMALGLAVATAGSFGCAFGDIRPHDPFAREFDLEEKHKRFSDLVRWAKYQEAAGFIKSEHRADFFAAMPDFGEVRFTDWKADPWELDEEMRETKIRVTYTGYSMTTPIEIDVHEIQHWTREGKGNNWSVVSQFEDLDLLAGN